MNLYNKLKLLELFDDGPTKSYLAEVLSTNETVLVHLLPHKDSPEYELIARYLSQLPPDTCKLILEQSEKDGNSYVITEKPANFRGLRPWLENLLEAKRQSPDPLAKAGFWKIPDPLSDTQEIAFTGPLQHPEASIRGLRPGLENLPKAKRRNPDPLAQARYWKIPDPLSDTQEVRSTGLFQSPKAPITPDRQPKPATPAEPFEAAKIGDTQAPAAATKQGGSTRTFAAPPPPPPLPLAPAVTSVSGKATLPSTKDANRPLILILAGLLAIAIALIAIFALKR